MSADAKEIVKLLTIEDGEIKSRIDVKAVFDEIFTLDFEQSRFERKMRQIERLQHESIEYGNCQRRDVI